MSPTSAPPTATPAVDLEAMGREARHASRVLATLSTERKNEVLWAIASSLECRAAGILAANAGDLARAREAGTGEAMLDRLRLTPERIDGLAGAVRQVADLPDPVGQDLEDRRLPNGLRLIRRRVPLGVLGAIYEARPNVTVDIAALALKTGNATILRGGSETLSTNRILVDAMRAALAGLGIPTGAVQLIESPDRGLVRGLLRMDRYVDMIVPRGGAALHALCREEGTIPVMTGGIGICHLFVDRTADLERAVDVVENAKVQRPTVCNALDTLLVDRRVADVFVPSVARRLARSGVELRCDAEAYELLAEADPDLEVELCAAGPGDFDREWLSLVLGVRIVDGLDEAVAHIRAHSTQHSDGILTGDPDAAERFIREVDSAAVYVNASTRFTDGGEFGLGAEVAVSTQKLHARGPMGLEALTTYKWIGIGDMHVRR